MSTEPKRNIQKAWLITLDKKGFGPMFEDDLYQAIIICSRWRALGFKPKMQRNPNPELKQEKGKRHDEV